MARDGRQRMRRQRGLDARHLAEVLAIAGRDRRSTARRRARGTARRRGTCRSRRESAGRHGAAGGPRRSARHAGDPQRLVRHRPGVEPLEGEDIPLGHASATTRGATPAVAAATVLWISFPRSTASRSVSAPGMRTKNGVPSTTTRQFVFVSPAGIRSAVTTRPAQSGIAATTCSIEGMVMAASARAAVAASVSASHAWKRSFVQPRRLTRRWNSPASMRTHRMSAAASSSSPSRSVAPLARRSRTTFPAPMRRSVTIASKTSRTSGSALAAPRTAS